MHYFSFLQVSKVVGAAVIAFAPLFGFQASAKSDGLYSYKSATKSKSDMSPSAQQAIYDAQKMYYENVQGIIEQNILDSYLDERAKSEKTSREALETKLFDVKVSEADAKKWFEENKSRLGGRTFDSVKNDVRQFILRQKQEEVRSDLASTVMKEGKFKLLLTEPEAPVLDIAIEKAPTKGGDNAKVTIVEFADYKCPHCKDASVSIKKIAKKFENKIKIVFMDFPLRLDSVSSEVAEGGYCAAQQGKFWEYHYNAFDQQASLVKDSPEKIAKDLGLNAETFKNCMESSASKEYVLSSRAEGERIGVQGTPAIFLNGRKMINSSYDELVSAVEAALKS